MVRLISNADHKTIDTALKENSEFLRKVERHGEITSIPASAIPKKQPAPSVWRRIFGWW